MKVLFDYFEETKRVLGSEHSFDSDQMP